DLLISLALHDALPILAIYTFISHINFSRNMPTEMSFYRSPSYSIIIGIVCFKVVLTTSRLNNLLPNHVDYSFPYLNQEDVRFQPSFLPVGYPLWSVVLLYLF